MSINTRGVMLCFKYAAQQMITQGGGGKIIGSSPRPKNSIRLLTRGVLHVHPGACSMAGKRGEFCFEAQVNRCQLKSASKGLPNICAYSMSKFAVRGLVQSLGKFVFLVLEPRA